MLGENLHFVWHLMRADFVLFIEVDLLLIFADVEVPGADSIPEAAHWLVRLDHLTNGEQGSNNIAFLFH